LTSIQEWFGCRHYINAGGYADVIVDNPFGTPLLTGDTLLVAKSQWCAAVTSLSNDTQVIAQWRSGPVFAFTHEYGKGRVYYQAAFDYALTHDLAVALDAPSGLEPGGSSLLDATVTNEGMNNETDVELFLLVDGAVVDSATIPELLTDSSYTLNYLWTPTVEGSYNITVYASPVSGENITTNNVVSKIVDVRERSVVYVDPETTTALLGETFVVEIKVAKVADLYAHEFKVFWDTALLDCVGSTINRIWYPNDYVVKDEILENYDAAHGRYWCAYLAYGPGEPPFNGDTTLVSLTFEATGLGTSALDLYDVTLVNSEAEVIEDWQSKDSPHDGYVTIQESTELNADVNSDGIVDIVDLVTCALAFGSKPGDDNWDPRADVANEFGLINIVDLVMIAIHFGETQ